MWQLNKETDLYFHPHTPSSICTSLHECFPIFKTMLQLTTCHPSFLQLENMFPARQFPHLGANRSRMEWDQVKTEDERAQENVRSLNIAQQTGHCGLTSGHGTKSMSHRSINSVFPS